MDIKVLVLIYFVLFSVMLHDSKCIHYNPISEFKMEIY